MKPALQTLTVLLLLVSVALVGAGIVLGTQSGTRWLVGQALQRVNSESLQIRYSEIRGSLLGGLAVTGLDIQLDDNRIHAGQVELVWQPTSLLGRTLLVDRLHAAGVVVDWHTAPADPDAPQGPSLDETLDSLLPLPVDLRASHIGAERLQLTLDGNELPLHSFRLGVALRDRRVTISDLDIQASPARLSGTAAMALEGDYTLQTSLSWSYRTGDETLLPLAGQLEAEGDLNRLRVEHRLQEPATMTTTGSVAAGLADSLNRRGTSPAPPLELDLQHEIRSLELDALGLSIAALSGWQLDGLSVSTAGTPQDLEVDGTLQLQGTLPGGSTDGSPLSLTARWQSVVQGATWQLDQLQLDAGGNRLQLSGLVDWSEVLTVDAGLQLDAPDPAAFYTLPSGLQLDSVRTQADVRLAMPESGIAGDVRLRELAARLNGQSLTGSGRVALDNNRLQVEDLVVRSGDNNVEANGTIGEMLDASLIIELPAISDLYPPARGAASAEVTLSGTPDAPSAVTTARVTGITLDGFSLDRLQLDGRIDGERVEADLQAEGLTSAGQTIEQVSGRIAGTLQDHSVSLQAAGTPAQLEIDVAGGLSDGRWEGLLQDSRVTSAFGVWQQNGAAELVASAEENSLSQTCWTQGNARLCTRASLSGSALSGAVELQNLPLGVLNHPGAEQILRDFHDGELPAAHITPPDDIRLPFALPQPLALTGTLNVTADVEGQLSELQDLRLNAEAGFNDLAIYLRGSEAMTTDLDEDAVPPGPAATVEQILWEQAEASVSLNEGAWTGEARMVIYQNELAGSGVSMRGTAQGRAALSAEGALDGSAELGFDDIAWVEALVPQLREPTGRLEGTLRVGGQLDSPSLGAELSLRDAMTGIPALGLQLEDIQLQLDNPQDDRFTLTGQLRSGEGTLQLDSELLRPLEDSRSVSLTLQGENVRMMDLPDLQVSLSPDLTLEGDLDGLSINGELHVPSLDATINELPESAVSVSADTVITTDAPGVRNAALAERGMLQNTPISGDIRISLGDQVHFSGFGLDTDLTGTLDITLRPEATPLTYGELEVVNGQFETYGQTLQIEQGKLQFLGSYNNPALDIRAVRDVGNTRVGVQMNGTLLNIRSQLFSTPALPDADVLAMLITGRPLSEAGAQESPSLVGAVARLGINQGQGLTDQIRGQLGLDTLALDAGRGGDLQDSSLTLGKYITPRIFVRYAVGLFDTENTLAIDYTLTDSLRLEAQSGETQSLDLIYQMER